jgi:hypothetical protein
MFTHKQLECQLHVWWCLLKDVVNEVWTSQHDITWTSNSTRGLRATHRHNHTCYHISSRKYTQTVIRCHHRVRKKSPIVSRTDYLFSVTFTDTGYNAIWSKRSHGIRPQINYSSGSQAYPYGFHGFSDHFPRNPWIHFCDGYFEVYLFFKLMECFFLTIAKLLSLAICLFHMTVRYPIKKLPVPTNRATIISIKFTRCNTLLPMLLVCIRSYVK